MVDLSDISTARGFVATWLTENHQRLGLIQVSVDVAEIPARLLSARYESSRHSFDVCAWEQAYCLDILVLEKSSGRAVFSVAGACDGIAAMSDRLEQFAEWAAGLQRVPG